jgi:protein SCO1
VRRGLLLLIVLGLTACGGTTAAPKQPTAKRPVSRFHGIAVPPTKAPPFALRDPSGHLVTLASQRHHYTLVTFLYTHCVDVCPLIAANLNEALRQLHASRARVSVLAISVDPKGDTPASVRAYARRMGLLPQFHYLVGTRAKLRPVWAAYGVEAVARKADVVDHVAYTVLVDPRGRERLIYDARVRASAVVHDLRALMDEKGARARG